MKQAWVRQGVVAELRWMGIGLVAIAVVCAGMSWWALGPEIRAWVNQECALRGMGPAFGPEWHNEQLKYPVATRKFIIPNRLWKADDGRAARYLCYVVDAPDTPPLFEGWCLSAATCSYSGAQEYTSGAEVLSSWAIWDGAAPAPTVTASDTGYLVTGAGDESYNGRYKLSGEVCNEQPVFERAP